MNPDLRNGRSGLCMELCKKYADLIDNDILEKMEAIGTYRNNRLYKKNLLKNEYGLKNPDELYFEYMLKVLFGIL